MSGMKVVSDSANPQLWKVLATAKLANIKVESQTDAKVDAAKNPLGKFPYLETSQGTLFEVNAIVRYIAKQGKGTLYGSNDFEVAQIEQYLDLANNDIDLPAAVWIFPILGLVANNANATQKAKGDIRKVLEYLNKQLLTKTYLVGERLTIADVVVALSLVHLYQKVLDANFRKGFVNTTRWFNTVVNQPAVKEVVGEVKLAEKAEVAQESAASDKKVEQPKKAEAPKKEQAPKKEAPKKAAKKDDEEEEENEYEEKEDKSANPLDALPKSKLVLDEWKRTYSNKDTRKEALPWFWENFDKEGYSIWKCDYKYNDELEKVFMTCNLIGGWYQRLDKLRKYAFGSVSIFGAEPKLEVQGVWMFRGLEIPQEMLTCDDSEQYTWTKLNVEDNSAKELVNDHWAWDGSFGGKTESGKAFNQGKVFK